MLLCSPADKGSLPFAEASAPLLVRYKARSRLFALPPQETSSNRIRLSVSFRLRIASLIVEGWKRYSAISGIGLEEDRRCVFPLCPLGRRNLAKDCK